MEYKHAIGDQHRRIRKMYEDTIIYFPGRKKDIILTITGGEKVYPLEIEHIIAELDEVSEAAVVGIQDEKWGEMVTAFIALKGQTYLSEENMTDTCK
ncbi:AMP-binding enzyme [Halalkalibacter alkalisediminis]|uniref:AMP-binding enzyme C-terminal domain-containing protein n=1 Tax=Halalkalibacter alkalisediminis TaxID=935616 RepID=A0ABV6NI82_9BACI|nr:hypothetical protein [Halalkalibacter alkalisediminis]